MDEMPEVLTEDLLVQFESLLRGLGFPLSSLNPGLNDSDIDALVRPAGLTLPKEARLWWRWHNGSQRDTEGRHGLGIGPGLFPMPAADALADRDLMLNLAQRAAPLWQTQPDRVWSPHWLPILRGLSSTFACDCSMSAADTTPVRWIDTHNMTPDGFWTVRAQSLGEMVCHWIDAIERGYWAFDPAATSWLPQDYDEIPRHLLDTGLV